jgi:hypothetical protein
MPACRWETNACCCCCNGFTLKPKENFRKRTRHSGRTQGGGGSRRKRDNKEKLLTLPSRPWLQKGDDGVFPMA